MICARRNRDRQSGDQRRVSCRSLVLMIGAVHRGSCVCHLGAQPGTKRHQMTFASRNSRVPLSSSPTQPLFHFPGAASSSVPRGGLQLRCHSGLETLTATVAEVLRRHPQLRRFLEAWQRLDRSWTVLKLPRRGRLVVTLTFHPVIPGRRMRREIPGSSLQAPRKDTE